MYGIIISPSWYQVGGDRVAIFRVSSRVEYVLSSFESSRVMKILANLIRVLEVEYRVIIRVIDTQENVLFLLNSKSKNIFFKLATM